MRTRLAISRASSPAITNPKPQFNHDAIIPITIVSDTAFLGVFGIEARRSSALCMEGELASAYPVTRISTI